MTLAFRCLMTGYWAPWISRWLVRALSGWCGGKNVGVSLPPVVSVICSFIFWYVFWFFREDLFAVIWGEGVRHRTTLHFASLWVALHSVRFGHVIVVSYSNLWLRWLCWCGLRGYLNFGLCGLLWGMFQRGCVWVKFVGEDGRNHFSVFFESRFCLFQCGYGRLWNCSLISPHGNLMRKGVEQRVVLQSGFGWIVHLTSYLALFFLSQLCFFGYLFTWRFWMSLFSSTPKCFSDFVSESLVRWSHCSFTWFSSNFPALWVYPLIVVQIAICLGTLFR